MKSLTFSRFTPLKRQNEQMRRSSKFMQRRGSQERPTFILPPSAHLIQDEWQTGEIEVITTQKLPIEMHIVQQLERLRVALLNRDNSKVTASVEALRQVGFIVGIEPARIALKKKRPHSARTERQN